MGWTSTLFALKHPQALLPNAHAGAVVAFTISFSSAQNNSYSEVNVITSA
jgi:hypothetical protein